jgi:hypothetical protein
MSSPININNTLKNRTISEEFMSRSENSKQIILGFTDGNPPSTSGKQIHDSPRKRVDSAGYSPVTESILKFHGIDSIPFSLFKKKQVFVNFKN